MSTTFFGVSGHYSPERSEKSVFRSSPAFSLCGRSKDGSNNQMPGNNCSLLKLCCKVSRRQVFVSVVSTAGPAEYTLPTLLGPKTATVSSAPTYSLYGRSKVGSFHDDLKKVQLIKNKEVTAYCFLNVCFLSRLLVLLPIKQWTHTFTIGNLHSTALQAATSLLKKPQKNQDLEHIILNRLETLLFHHKAKANVILRLHFPL